MTLALKIRGLRKSYGAVHALRGMDLDVRPGEIHGLLGQNGCGKSTLIKSITGVIAPDEGEVEVYGSVLPLPVTHAPTHGMAVVHQDVGLADSMTVLENLGVTASYGSRAFAPVNERRERRIAHDLLSSLGLDIDLDVPVRQLSPAQRAMMGIVRALRDLDAHEGRAVLLLDEPTAALGRDESEQVLDLMRRVAAAGSAVVFISHRLNEVMATCDAVTIMRDGLVAHSGSVADLTREGIVAHMLGRTIDDFFPPPPTVPGDRIRLRVRGLTGAVVTSVNLDVLEGEIVGVTGLAGMGQAELVRLLAAADIADAGSIAVDETPVKTSGPADAIRAGISFVPGNRYRDGGWLAASAAENVTLPVLSRFMRGALRLREEARYATETLARLQLRPLAPERPMSSFSGGNQQKVVFAKWLQTEPKVLLLEEPTQGVDPGAARELLDQVVGAAARGASVLVFSGDNEQLVEICHRVIVMSHGRITAQLSRDELSEERIVAASVTVE